MYYAQAAQAFRAGIKCSHCEYRVVKVTDIDFALGKTNFYGLENTSKILGIVTFPKDFSKPCTHN